MQTYFPSKRLLPMLKCRFEPGLGLGFLGISVLFSGADCQRFSLVSLPSFISGWFHPLK